ncbi:hypothetical protein DDR33_17005 [Pararcticibacter amylolyticus]|uniref:Uncharacterized protein n=1 Tax=Pararcticibacter amylolyticus TaxID=2173175 RepID=A0A2U2PDJ3_9SPHI|nr:hypothetical protein DDR33_17005 [Pararcticibacter amylolyticus]
MKISQFVKALGIFPLFLYFLVTSIWDLSAVTKHYILAFVILTGSVSIFLRRRELQEKGKHTFLIMAICLVATALIFYFQGKAIE